MVSGTSLEKYEQENQIPINILGLSVEFALVNFPNAKLKIIHPGDKLLAVAWLNRLPLRAGFVRYRAFG